jgi:hypothetical protein
MVRVRQHRKLLKNGGDLLALLVAVYIPPSSCAYSAQPRCANRSGAITVAISWNRFIVAHDPGDLLRT